GGAEQAVRLSHEGRERLFLPRAVVLRNGRPEGVVVALEDVTDRVRGREVHASLLANAAHDLEKAVGSLQSALEPLEAEKLGPLTAHQKQRLAGVRTDGQRLAEIAANLQAMSRLEERRRQLHVEPVPPGDLVQAAVREAAPGYQGEQVKLQAEADPEAPRVLADRERVGLVLASLLRNARPHTPAGGAVTVKAVPWDGRVRFAVSDTGAGIPPAHLERIFEPFYQVPGSQDLGGVGLGLAIAKEIVQAHGGEIHVESEEGRGTTVWFTLPAAAE